MEKISLFRLAFSTKRLIGKISLTFLFLRNKYTYLSVRIYYLFAKMNLCLRIILFNLNHLDRALRTCQLLGRKRVYLPWRDGVRVRGSALVRELESFSDKRKKEACHDYR
jgi:hypothetical protein